MRGLFADMRATIGRIWEKFCAEDPEARRERIMQEVEDRFRAAVSLQEAFREFLTEPQTGAMEPRQGSGHALRTFKFAPPPKSHTAAMSDRQDWLAKHIVASAGRQVRARCLMGHLIAIADAAVDGMPSVPIMF